MSEQSINEKHKDRLFNFIFGSEKHKDWTLSLYNAVNNSHYTDPDLIKFNTLKEFAWLIDCIRKNQADTDIATAARNAVRSMPDEYLIKQFLIANLEEVIGMLDTEYNEAEIRELFRADAYREFKDELDKNAATIAEKNATIAEKDAALADKDAALADKDALISKLQAELKSLRDR